MARKPTESAALKRLRALLSSGAPPQNPDMLRRALHDWLRLEIPTTPLAPGSAAPFDYLVHSFFEGTFRRCSGRWRRVAPGRRSAPCDSVVWAARGAGKTFLGAVATMLDLVYKKGIEVRILGGSLEQSERMHEHLRRLFESPAIAGMVNGRITGRRLTLASGSRAQILAQSQTSVRGTRVQKLRCDEVELFDPEVWQAAQLTTRSKKIRGPWGDTVGGSIEALSTMHRPYGLMWNLVGGGVGGASGPGASRPAGDTPVGPERPRLVFRWGLIDVLGRCGPEHACRTCTLEPDCSGRAKERDARRGGGGRGGISPGTSASPTPSA